ncbi:S-layer homology domain-containing protein [Halalkalibacter nanhaiisediminis]|uniref:S-layer family protein n=1 Tax=Halalkalibacter nanhaiisediminis TaxID=688079 RepID=A0A562QT78_9BACI|nr:S-layer homology domain-containing protein [Halalkalibacter nanhaiisediminis]TWI59925.1 S-layer family protein [Halalkalibacter nanhaiisediminis]
MKFQKRIPYAVLSTTFASLLLVSAVSAEETIDAQPISEEFSEKEVTEEVPIGEETDEEVEEVIDEEAEDEIVEEEEVVPSFADVPKDHFAFAAIEYLYLQGLINGKSEGQFAPTDSISRAEAATMVANALQLTASTNYQLKASDVKRTHWAFDSLRALEEQGILTGYNGDIRPNDTMSRAEVSAILDRAFNYASPTRFFSFSDLNRSHWAYESVNVLAANGITSQAGGAYRPLANTSRAEFAAFLARSLDDRFK